MTTRNYRQKRVPTASGETRMRRPATTAAATLTAIGLALTASLPSIAQDSSGAPVDLLNRGSDVSIRSNGAAAPTGYFVGADGSIQYGDPAGDTPSQPVMDAPVMVGSESDFDAFPADPMADAMVSAPMAADVFDAAPQGGEAVTLQTLQSAFASEGMSDSMAMDSVQQMVIEEAVVDASASAGNYYGGNPVGFDAGSGMVETQAASDSYGYAIENGVVMPAAPAQPAYAGDYTSEPVMEQTVETYQVTVTPPPVPTGQVLAPLAPAMPSYAEPVFPEIGYGESIIAETVVSVPVPSMPMAAEPFVAQPYVAEPYVAEPVMAVPVYSEPAPVTISTRPAEQSFNAYASLEPAPLAPSGRSFAGRGDGSYGPSTIKNTGDGPSAQRAAVFIAKSTIVELPAEAHEVIVSDPKLVRAVLRTARQIVLIGLQAGQTGITVFDERGNQILSLDTNIQYDLRPLRIALAETFPGVQVEVESVLGEVILKGSTAGAAESDAIRDLVRRYLYSAMIAAGVTIKPNKVAFVDRLTTSSDDQILVKVRIAEMRRSIIKQFGVDFNLATDAALSAATGGLNNAVNTFGSISNSFGVSGAAMGGIAANIAGSFGDTNFGGLVQAFEQHNVMRVLAEPTLTAVSGETASFLAGGEFAFPTSADENGVGFTFRDFGVALEFTPVVIGDGRISLTVATEISELTTEGSVNTGDLTIPGLSIRRANTTVELPSGGTMSIAGMLLQRDAAAHAGLPGLKNVPIVGQLLSSTDYQKQETELVILVTPYVVKPGQEKEFRLPTDGFAPASDFDLYLLGRLQKVYGAGDPNMASAREALKAPFGFILE